MPTKVVREEIKTLTAEYIPRVSGDILPKRILEAYEQNIENTEVTIIHFALFKAFFFTPST
jgi:hypothetical protein